MSRDSTLFVDDDGTAYFVSAANNNADLHFYRLSADYLAIDSLIANPWPGQSREAPALFKRNGVYFLLSSTTSGWNPNQQKYSTATSLAGPWSAQAEAGNSTTYGSQTAYVLPVQARPEPRTCIWATGGVIRSVARSTTRSTSGCR